MKKIEYQEGMTMEDLVNKINDRIERVNTLHNQFNQFAIICDDSFKNVLSELKKHSSQLKTLSSQFKKQEDKIDSLPDILIERLRQNNLIKK